MKQITQIPKLSKRDQNSHKGTFGKILIIGGSTGMSGAPALAGMSALRTGSGLVRLAVSKSVLPIVASINPCYTTIQLQEDKNGRISSKAFGSILDNINQNDAIAFGPGCGISDQIRGILEKIIGLDIKLVIDADGLNCLCGVYQWHTKVKADIILTPHPGEMARLWKSVFRNEMPDDRVETAVKFSSETNTTVVLKGHNTVVAKENNYYINQTGNPGMATAGSGDVLTGMITSLTGQGLSSFDAAVLGVYQHGIAGDKAAEKRGQASMIAADIIDNIVI